MQHIAFFKRIQRVAICFFLIALVPYQALASDYSGTPWGSSFPTLEKKYPAIEFDKENAWRVVTFYLSNPPDKMSRLEFKLFDEKLTAVVHKIAGPLEPFMNEKYLRKYLGDLGKRVKVEKRKIPSIHGMTDAVLWDYGEIMVFFQTYPPVKDKDTPQPLNMIKFVHRPIFNTMMAFIKENPDGDPNVISDDFDAVAF